MARSDERETITWLGRLAALFAASSVLLCERAASAATWPHFGYDDQYTSYCTGSTRIKAGNVAKLRLQWGLSCDDGYFFVVFGSPAVHDGIVYTSGAGTRLTALDGHTGETLWQFGKGNYGWAPQPIVSDDGVVFYLEDVNPTSLYAVNRSGKQLWKAPVSFEYGFREASEAVPTVDETSKIVYVVENPSDPEGGRLFALSKGSGKVLWYKSKAKDGVAFRGRHVLLKGSSLFAVALLPDNVCSWGEETFVRINSTTKKTEIKYAKPQIGTCLRVGRYTLCDDTLIVEYCDRDSGDPAAKSISVLAAYNLNSPSIIWQKDLSSTPVTGGLAGNPVKKRIYVPTDPYLFSLNSDTGKQIWKYTGYDPIYTPSIANGIVFFTSDTNMYALKEATGKRLLSYDLGYNAESSMQVAVGEDAVWLSGSGGTCDFIALALPAGSAYRR